MSEAKPMLYEVKLLATELLLLDGKCSESAQLIVDRAKLSEALESSGLSERERVMVAKIVEIAKTQKRLTYWSSPITSCNCCGRFDGYWPVARRTKYKRKGEPDRDNPKVFNGYMVDYSNVSVKHYIGNGVCVSCAPRVIPVLRAALEGVAFESAVPGIERPHKRVAVWECPCGWKGLETEVLWMPAIFGGRYRGKCPACKVGREPFGSDKDKVRQTREFRIVTSAILPKTP